MSPIQFISLICVQCRKEQRTLRTTYAGKPITQWWKEQGERCRRCISFGPARKMPQQVITTPPPPPPPAAPAPASCQIEEDFRAFHEKNPHVYEALVREGRALLARGHRKFGMKMLYERLRWQVYMETRDDKHEFKLPNNYTAWYARLIADQEPDFSGVFATASLRSTW